MQAKKIIQDIENCRYRYGMTHATNGIAKYIFRAVHYWTSLFYENPSRDARDMARRNGVIVEHYGDRPLFHYDEEKISLPAPKFYLSNLDYAQDLLHELMHFGTYLHYGCTTHKNAEEYAYREIVAEIGSILLLEELGYYDDFCYRNAIAYAKQYANKIPKYLVKRAVKDAFTISQKLCQIRRYV